MRTILIALIALLAAVAPARADWNDTRWGMSKETVHRLYPGGDTRYNDFTIFREGVYRGIKWRSVHFTFMSTGEGLERVSLESREPATVLRQKLKALFGASAPERDGTWQADRYVDRASGDKIVMVTDTRQDWSSITWSTGRSLRPTIAVTPGEAPQWYSPLTEFRANFPTARRLMEGSIFWGLDAPHMHGRAWRRGNFDFSGDKLYSYTLFSADSHAAVMADFTARFGPPQTRGLDQEFTDRADGSILAVRRNGDGTAIVAVRPPLRGG